MLSRELELDLQCFTGLPWVFLLILECVALFRSRDHKALLRLGTDDSDSITVTFNLPAGSFLDEARRLSQYLLNQ